jgi:hypothetical protein
VVRQSNFILFVVTTSKKEKNDFKAVFMYYLKPKRLLQKKYQACLREESGEIKQSELFW